MWLQATWHDNIFHACFHSCKLEYTIFDKMKRPERVCMHAPLRNNDEQNIRLSAWLAAYLSSQQQKVSLSSVRHMSRGSINIKFASRYNLLLHVNGKKWSGRRARRVRKIRTSFMAWARKMCGAAVTWKKKIHTFPNNQSDECWCHSIHG